MPEAMTMGHVVTRVGIRESAIRYYEKEGLLPTRPRRGGRRTFDDAAVARLQMIHAARELGFSVEEIRELVRDLPERAPPPERWRALARRKLPEIDAQIRRARALRRMLHDGMSCGCVDVEQCFLEGCTPGPEAGPTMVRIAGRPPAGDPA